MPSTVYNSEFNGMEFQYSLNYNTYDFGARHYDPAIGRWNGVDALSEKFSSNTPYGFGFNNPVFFVDRGSFEPTPYEAALIANHVYSGSGKLAGGWKVSSSFREIRKEAYIGRNGAISLGGLTASLYERTKGDGTKEYVLAFAGTDDLQDIFEDIIQPFVLTASYRKSVELAKELSVSMQKKEITYVGHSLGGCLANAASLATGRTSNTFNPAWISKATLKEISQKPLNDGASRRNYIHKKDPLDHFQRGFGVKEALGLVEIGERIMLKGDWFDTLATGHFISQVIDAFDDMDLDYIHLRDGDDRIIDEGRP